jgi:phage/plasmid-associated DNA primase
LQQWTGYCLTGDTSEQALVFIYGLGGNGKSLFQGVPTDIMAGYAKTAAMDTFVASKHPRHLTELAEPSAHSAWAGIEDYPQGGCEPEPAAQSVRLPERG